MKFISIAKSTVMLPRKSTACHEVIQAWDKGHLLGVCFSNVANIQRGFQRRSRFDLRTIDYSSFEEYESMRGLLSRAEDKESIAFVLKPAPSTTN